MDDTDRLAREAERAAGNSGLGLAFETVEATLRAESWFLETVRAELSRAAPLDSFPTVMGPSGHDYLLHFTQFLFFLEALNCTEAEHIARFIDGHNERIEGMIASPDFSKSVNEFRKAIFRPERADRVVETIRHFGAPVFAIYEFAHLLIDEMSPKTTEKLIEDLRYGRLLERREDNRIDADGKRVLLASTGFLERTYRRSLLLQRRLIALSLSPAEMTRMEGDPGDGG